MTVELHRQYFFSSSLMIDTMTGKPSATLYQSFWYFNDIIDTATGEFQSHRSSHQNISHSHSVITMSFNNMYTLKFKAVPTNAFLSRSVNQMLVLQSNLMYCLYPFIIKPVFFCNNFYRFCYWKRYCFGRARTTE